MNLQEFLRSVPVARKNTLAIYTVLFALFCIAIVVFEEMISEYDFDIVFTLIIVLVLGAFWIFFVFLLRRFALPTKQVELALKKADYMYSCVSKLTPTQQDVVKSEIQHKLDRMWRSKSYMFTRMVTPPRFGEHCMYGKVVTRKTLGINQHVILPYQNISEVIMNEPRTGANKTVFAAKNAKSDASMVTSAVTEGGVDFGFTDKRPTIVVVDDAGNAYQIDCPDPDWFVDKLQEQVEKIGKPS